MEDYKLHDEFFFITQALHSVTSIQLIPHSTGLAKRNPYAICQWFFTILISISPKVDANRSLGAGYASVKRGHWEVLEVEIDRKRISLSMKGLE